MIDVEYAYIRKNNSIIKCTASFRNVNSAIRFIFKCFNHPNMVFMSLTCDDAYDEDYIRRVCKL